MKREGKELVLNFDGAPAPARGYLLAGSDGVWKVAKARANGAQVHVWSREVPEPLKLRFAWADRPEIDEKQPLASPGFEAELKR